MKNQIIKVKPTVEKLLKENPILRDNDYRLIAVIWRDLCPSPGQSADKFFSDFAEGKYPHPESIRRSRAKLQKANPELRGKLYGKRKGELDAEIREEMVKEWEVTNEEIVAPTEQAKPETGDTDPKGKTGFVSDLFTNFFKPGK